MTAGIEHPVVDTRRTAIVVIRVWAVEGSSGLRAHVVWQLVGDRGFREARGADGSAATTAIVEDLLKRFEASQL